MYVIHSQLSGQRWTPYITRKIRLDSVYVIRKNVSTDADSDSTIKIITLQILTWLEVIIVFGFSFCEICYYMQYI